jgi:hypothetical protein
MGIIGVKEMVVKPCVTRIYEQWTGQVAYGSRASREVYLQVLS